GTGSCRGCGSSPARASPLVRMSWEIQRSARSKVSSATGGSPAKLLVSSPAGDDVIAWRGNHRYVERLSRATLDAEHGDAVVRVDGSYIITGGLGGLGTAVTRWLSERGAGRLILNGRTDPSEDQREVLA